MSCKDSQIYCGHGNISRVENLWLAPLTTLVSWLVGYFGLNGPLRQYFSLYRVVSQREGERKEK